MCSGWAGGSSADCGRCFVVCGRRKSIQVQEEKGAARRGVEAICVFEDVAFQGAIETIIEQ
jgi:hypothetical protein